MASRHFAIRADRSLKETARELDADTAAEPLTPRPMPTNPESNWGERSLAEMDSAEAKLKRVAAEVRAAPALIENANRRFHRFVREERKRDRERAKRKE